MQYQNLRNQWGVRMFETCERERSNDNAKDEQNTIGLSNVESLKTDTLRMSAETLNFWLCKFVQKVRLPYDLLRINILFAVVVILFLIMSYIQRSCM